ncbi:MAG: DJ-1/PfpI family protein [Candidatus Methanomethylicaceae archaeon]|nr:DJ-1/PfpI family protein [Candidatus Verstraetearchaeota archaeon]
MAKILIVIAERMFRDEEFSIPKYFLEGYGHEVKVASTGKGPAIGKFGTIVEPDLTLDEVNAKDYNVIIIAGGPGTPIYLWPNERLHKIVREIYDNGGIVAAICLAPVVLSRAGILNEKRCTVFPTPDSIKEIRKGGGILEDYDVVVDDRIITANGPEASQKFTEAILARIGG